ncbi:SRPBCC family protein [Cyclobacterium marinum]|uniref:hypothetical protein n=1 Tax=Cyclobacterium marinum TaxID=104 RepID=UPI001F55386D|nr:hypothetical protein [Cyclobacterium marinum]
MEAKNGTMGFDFSGVYKKVIERIAYQLSDDRNVTGEFHVVDNEVQIVERLEAEGINTVQQQEAGWQSILHNFKCYVESIK